MAKFMRPVYGITNNSILSDSLLNISFSKIYCNSIGGVRYVDGYTIAIEKKSEQNIYIDLANSFKIDDAGNAESYFSNKTYTTNQSAGSGGSLNLGAIAGAAGIGGVVGTLANGMNIGGGNTKGTTVSETEERILVIPPHGKRTLPLAKEATKKEIIEIPERFIPHEQGSFDITRHQFKELYTEDNSPSVYKRIITYSTYPDFSSYTRLNIGLYFKSALGETWWNAYNHLYFNENHIQATNWDHLIANRWDEIKRINKSESTMQKK